MTYLQDNTLQNKKIDEINFLLLDTQNSDSFTTLYTTENSTSSSESLKVARNLVTQSQTLYENSNDSELIFLLPLAHLGENLKVLLHLKLLNDTSLFWRQALNSVTFIDLFLIIILFAFFSRSLVKLLRQIYYSLFAQINLFTYKLNKYNKNMLKSSDDSRAKNKHFLSTDSTDREKGEANLRKKNREQVTEKAKKLIKRSKVVPKSMVKRRTSKAKSIEILKSQISMKQPDEIDSIEDDYEEFKLEEMIFLEDNEIKSFFQQFFKVFKRNSANNQLDISRVPLKDIVRGKGDSTEGSGEREVKSSNGIFKNRRYRVKFNENMVKPVEKALMGRRRARNKSIMNF